MKFRMLSMSVQQRFKQLEQQILFVQHFVIEMNSIMSMLNLYSKL